MMQGEKTRLYVGQSLHIGLNKVDPRYYGGWAGQLSGCHNDAMDMTRIAKALGYTTKTLLDGQATIEGVLAAIENARKLLDPADVFLLTYSGHGGQVPDANHDEDDHLDETWCLFNGELVDDVLFNNLAKFPSRARIMVVSDSCHSGTVTRERIGPRGMPSQVIQPAYEARKEYYDSLYRAGRAKYQTDCTIGLLSGCQDNQTSMDGEVNGLFTEKLLRVWNNGEFAGDYWQFIRAIVRLMPADQTPGLNFVGRRNLNFEWAKPFTIR